ncbi:OLC1v1007662C1 [Oldenlandia corymbosa var. corymbosa]|nr:OLC1v1007662C1 [Oldenlandia corymbosa var. corymbosa]
MEKKDSYKQVSGPKYDCLLFDVDDTLYPFSSGISAEVTKNIMEYMITKLGVKEENVKELNGQLYKEYGTTMAGLRAIGYDFDYDDYHAFVHGRLPYDKLLKPDPVLRNLLHSLPIRKFVFSNANDAHVAKVLSRLGLEDCFEGIITFETLNPSHNSSVPNEDDVSELPKIPVVCKPFAEAFETVFKVADIDPEKTVFFDDSIRNLKTAKSLGVHTVWVGSSHRTNGVDHALESIHNVREALPELWEAIEAEASDARYSGKLAIETSQESSCFCSPSSSCCPEHHQRMAESNQPFRQTRSAGGRNAQFSSSSSSTTSDSRYQPPHNRNFNPRRKVQPVNNLSSNFTRSNEKNTTENRAPIRGDDIVDESGENNRHPTIIGTCPYMCPVEERLRRERLRDLAVFERLYGDPGKSSPSLAAKKFCRTISTRDMQASDLRPLSVLDETLNYLLGLFDSKEHPFDVVHDFIFDRTRSIRQDLSMQNITNRQAITMYERMVKFHIFSHQRLYRSCSSPNVSSALHLNLEQLNKSLTTLFNLYEANDTSPTHENEAEFRSIYVLLQIHPDSKGEPLSLWFRGLHSAVMKSKPMHFAKDILRYFRLGNYKRFMYTLETQASVLQYCIVEPCINEVRALAVCCLNQAGYKLQPIPLEDLSNILSLEESDVESFCNDCGLHITTDEVGNKFLTPKQSSFRLPKSGLQKHYPLCFEGLAR